MLSDPELALSQSTARVRLRAPILSDAAPLAALMTPGISRRLASWPYPCDPAHVASRIEASWQRRASGAALALVVEHLALGQPIGWVGLALPAPGVTHALLTYWLSEAHQGHGYMREAAPVALRLGFAHLDIAAVRAAVQPDNGMSLSVLRGLGMRRLGPGHIWCEARRREEPCEYWEAPRPATPVAAATSVLPAAALAHLLQAANALTAAPAEPSSLDLHL
jgi:[ribosomal protein S5]-alanine N-acetyltransferase